MPSIHYLSITKRKGGRIIAALMALTIGYILGVQSLEAVKDYAAAERQKHEMAINIKHFTYIHRWIVVCIRLRIEFK